MYTYKSKGQKNGNKITESVNKTEKGKGKKKKWENKSKKENILFCERKKGFEMLFVCFNVNSQIYGSFIKNPNKRIRK